MASARAMALHLVIFVAPLISFAQGRAANDRAITEVVKLLESMLSTSKTEGDSEQVLYAKYKCYCDNTEEEKNAEIEDLTSEIGLLENKIEELRASTGLLSTDIQGLKREMASNNQSQDEASALRKKENEAFKLKSADLSDAIKQMNLATKTLADIGADQTLQSAADHDLYMAGHKVSLSALRSTVQHALVAASSLTTPHQAASIDAFLQAPFTGTYTAQSGEVVGILKDMRDTFKANLATAIAEEAKALVAFNKFMANMDQIWGQMDNERTSKEKTLASNDSSLSAKLKQLSFAKESLSEAQIFLASMLERCASKKEQYEKRVEMRTNEDAAISQAIAILNSDAAFANFGTVSATSFVQYKSIHEHSIQDADAPRSRVQAFLQKAAGTQGSPLLGRVVALLQGKNPFHTVLTEIDKMIKLVAAEEAADVEQKEWCEKERQDTKKSINTLTEQIGSLQASLHKVIVEIADPETGLQKQIADTQSSLAENKKNQVEETNERTAENLAYQKDIKNLVDAEALISRAIEVLDKYYAQIETQFLQKEAPKTWNDKYMGQSENGKGAISTLEFILANTKQEEKQAHDDELKAQHSFEDSMTFLKSQEASSLKALSNLKATLAQKEMELASLDKELNAAEKEKAAHLNYLDKIRSGCDFIATNYEIRSMNRKSETQALSTAAGMLKDTPAFANAEDQAHEKSLGDCLLKCDNEEHVECKACLAKVSIPGYCAGHPQTEGCANN